MLLLLALVGWVTGRTLDRCELAEELMSKGASVHQIPTWLCIAQHESNYNTSAVSRHDADGSAYHGIFQISGRYWCSPKGKACHLSCDRLEDDDISDDWECANKIFREHTFISGNGFKAWATYFLRCFGDNMAYIKGCYNVLTAFQEHEIQEALQVSSTSTSSSTEETKYLSAPKKANSASKMQGIYLGAMTKKQKSLGELPHRLWKPWTWEIFQVSNE